MRLRVIDVSRSLVRMYKLSLNINHRDKDKWAFTGAAMLTKWFKVKVNYEIKPDEFYCNSRHFGLMNNVLYLFEWDWFQIVTIDTTLNSIRPMELVIRCWQTNNIGLPEYLWKTVPWFKQFLEHFSNILGQHVTLHPWHTVVK